MYLLIPKLPIHLSLVLISLAATVYSLCCESVSVCKYVHLCHTLYSTYKWYMVFVFLFLCMIISRSIHVAAHGINFILFNGCIILHYAHVYSLLYPLICQWAFGCFHILTVVNSAAMNIRVHIPLKIFLFTYFYNFY